MAGTSIANGNPHARVAVKSETGTLDISGMGKDYAGYTDYCWDGIGTPADPTGRIRLDPASAQVPDKTSNDNIYRTDCYY